MLDALYISAIGLQAQKEQLDAAAGNLANLATPAFKRQSVDFAALLDRAPAGRELPAVAGVHPSRVRHVDLAPGEVRATGRALDVAIVGNGFLEVELPGEQTGYSRAGSLQINAEGMLSLASGQLLKADVRVPEGASDVQILADGSVTALLSGDAEPSVLGQLELVRFDNPDSLEYRGAGVFTAPEDALQGALEPIRARPGEDGTAELATRSLEGSNVRLNDEMVSLLLMQRAYELNSRVVQAADELLSLSNNLRRS